MFLMPGSRARPRPQLSPSLQPTLDSFAAEGLQFNGAMEISQETASTIVPSVSGVRQFICDGYAFFFTSTSAAFTVQQTQTTNPPFGNTMPNCINIKSSVPTASISSGDFNVVVHSIEGYRFVRAGWGTATAQPITIGFWIEAAAAGTFGLSVRNSANSRSYVTNIHINNAVTWEWKTVIIPGDTAGTWLQTNGAGAIITFGLVAGTTFQTQANTWVTGNFIGTPSVSNTFFNTINNNVAITGFVVLVGAHQIPQAISPQLQRPVTQELPLCQRYYEMSYSQGVTPRSTVNQGNTAITIGPLPAAQYTYLTAIPYKVTKRSSSPTITLFSPNTGSSGKVFDSASGVDVTGNISAGSNDQQLLWFAIGSSAETQIAFAAHWVADARL